MDILGIGPLELLFILLIALIILGPNDMVKTGRTIGRYLRRLVKSDTWRTIQQTSREIRHMPNRLMRDAGLEEDLQDINQIRDQLGSLNKIGGDLGLEGISQELKDTQADLSAWTTPPPKPSSPPETTKVANTVEPAPSSEVVDPEPHNNAADQT